MLAPLLPPGEGRKVMPLLDAPQDPAGDFTKSGVHRGIQGRNRPGIRRIEYRRAGRHDPPADDNAAAIVQEHDMELRHGGFTGDFKGHFFFQFYWAVLLFLALSSLSMRGALWVIVLQVEV